MGIRREYIHRCLDLAELGRGRTGINPMVGAVLVRSGNIIAESWHEEFGGPHAEASLIKKFDQEFHEDNGLYINVEPCCHTDKKTPPCTEAIIKSGIKHVIIGMLDPNPAVCGKGMRELQKYGIEVIGPIERARCEWFNRGFVSLMTKGRPWVTCKRAQGRKGAIAHDDGSKMKITNAQQDRWSHQFLRAKHDAILVGVGTVVSDDPRLTIRHAAHFAKATRARECGMRNHPLRVVLDPHVRIPLNAKVVSGEMAGGTMIIRKEAEEAEDAEHAGESKEKMLLLQERGVQVVSIPVDASGMFSMAALFHVLTTPTENFHGITSMLVEGGQRTWEIFRKAGVVDSEVTLVG